MYKIEKKKTVIIFLHLIERFFNILEIIQYAIFTTLIAINDNDIFHVKDEEFLSTINIQRRREMVEFL